MLSVRTLLWLLCSIALALRVSGMHMHLDDAHGDTPLGLHMALVGVDSEYHHDHSDGHHHEAPQTDSDYASHTDSHDHPSVDLGLENQALTKNVVDDPGCWLLVATLLCFLLTPRTLRVARLQRLLPKPDRPPRLRPPLRGPPAYA